MKDSGTSLKEKQGDIGTVAAATAGLTGQSQQGWWTRLFPFRAYLDRVAMRAFPVELRVKCHVHTSAVSDVTRSLVEHAGEFGRT